MDCEHYRYNVGRVVVIGLGMIKISFYKPTLNLLNNEVVVK